MNVYIQLTSAGVDTGPFSLYSDVDAYVSAFQTNISRTTLLNGFLCTVVPTSTTIIRVQSTNDCANYIDLPLQTTPTTTTTTSSTTTSTTSTTSSTTTTTTTLPIECIDYGALYNWYAATEARKISSSDDWIVPTLPDWTVLINYIGGTVVVGGTSPVGGKLKETGLTYWITPNTGATNEYDFNVRGGNFRLSDGSFLASLGTAATLYSLGTTGPFGNVVIGFGNSTNLVTFGGSNAKEGLSIRLLYTGVGTPTSYTGNDGKIYRVVTIGTQTWLADNLLETKYRNGDYIHGFEGGVYVPISDVDWAALTTEGMCVYADDLDNAFCTPPVTTTTTTTLPTATIEIYNTSIDLVVNSISVAGDNITGATFPNNPGEDTIGFTTHVDSTYEIIINLAAEGLADQELIIYDSNGDVTTIPYTGTGVGITFTNQYIDLITPVKIYISAGTLTATQTILAGRAVNGIEFMDAYELCSEFYDTELVDINSVQQLYFASYDPVPTVGDMLFTDYGLTTPFISAGGGWWGVITSWDIVTNNTYNYIAQISEYGEVLDIQLCSGITTTTTTTLIYHMDMCVNSTTYDEPNEVSIPISLSPTIINSPTKAGYNYFFLSIPTIYTFTLKDSLGTDITSSMSLDPASGTGGTDIRPGYFNNYIYKSDDTFATDFSTEFTLTLS